MPSELPVVDILGIPVAAWRLEDLLKWVDDQIKDPHPAVKTVMYANVHTMNLACQNPQFHSILRAADVVYCDGAGVRIGARLLNQDIPERMTGADWIYDLCGLAERKKRRLFFIGGREGIAERAVSRLKTRFPRLMVAGTHNGYFHGHAHQQEALLARLEAADIDILLVGMGSPMQEFWIESHISQLSMPVVWAMGAVMDFVAGAVPRAPAWMRRHHLEWLYRLKTEPRRLWRRYTVGNAMFMIRILGDRLTRSERIRR
jgi:N-acetylglucosaminyldiphosphoundecaprenol N-acetyl-beta-D-mannosaminyltransferase